MICRKRVMVKATRLLTLAAIAVGLGYNVTLLWLWWSASKSEWRILVEFNAANEALLEGVLMHLSLGVLGAFFLYKLRSYFGK